MEDKDKIIAELKAENARLKEDLKQKQHKLKSGIRLKQINIFLL